MKRVPFRDLYSLPEADRINAIGNAAGTKMVGVALEKDEPEKIARYIRKVTELYPKVRHIATRDGLVPGVVLVQFGPKATQ